VAFYIETNLWNGKRGLLKNSTLFFLFANTKDWGIDILSKHVIPPTKLE
jgi:hypothetical protein